MFKHACSHSSCDSELQWKDIFLIFQVILGLVQFGFVGMYLSEPLVRAYTTAAATHAVVTQLKHILGVSATRFSGPFSLVYVSTQTFTPFVATYSKLIDLVIVVFLRIH